jgi:hypothetical protein
MLKFKILFGVCLSLVINAELTQFFLSREAAVYFREIEEAPFSPSGKA